MISLRELKEKDAEFMLEWMHDKEVQKGFKRNMLEATISDAKNFCISSSLPEKLEDDISLNFAIVDEADEYLGTISLKDIDIKNKRGEYAIVLRRSKWGKGVAFKATGLLLDKAFNEYGLHRVFLTVYGNNDNAIKLYEKSGFVFEGEFREHFLSNDGSINWKLYGILSDEFDKTRFEIR